MSDPHPPIEPETPPNDKSGAGSERLNIAPRNLTRKLRELTEHERKSPIKLSRTSTKDPARDGSTPKPQPQPLPAPALQLPQSDSRPAIRPYLVTPPHKRAPGVVMPRPGPRFEADSLPTSGRAVESIREQPSFSLPRPVLVGLLLFSIVAGVVGTYIFVRAFSPDTENAVENPAVAAFRPTPAGSPAPTSGADEPAPPPQDSNPVIAKYLARIAELSEKGDARALERLFNQTLEERSRDPRYWMAMDAAWARVFSKEGMGGKKIAERLAPFTNHALQYAPGHPLVLERAGVHAMEFGRIDEALGYFRRARDAAPQSAPIRRQLLFALIARDENKEALAIAREWVLEQPADVDLRRILANLYQREKDLDRAIDHQRILVRLDPSSVPDAAQLMTMLRQAGRAAEMPAIFRDLAKDPSVNANMIYMLGSAELAAGNHAEALAAFRRFLHRASKDIGLTANFHTQFATALAGTGDIAGAEKSYRTALALDPEFADASNNLAYLLVDNGGSLEEAGRLVDRALGSRPDHPPYLDTKGRVLLASGKPAEALVVLRKATDLSKPPDADILLHLDDAYAALGERDNARAAWTRAREIQPTHAASTARLADPDPAP